jgi:hypothetical protein
LLAQQGRYGLRVQAEHVGNNVPSPAVLETDLWAVHCHAATENCANPASWNEETRVTSASFDIRQAPFARGYFLGDYQGLAAAGNRFISVFGIAPGVPGTSSIFFSEIGP